MNVRFSEQAVRCRVTRSELDRLLSGRAAALEVALPREHVFLVNIRPTTLSEWRFDTDPTGLWLTIPRTALESLAQAPLSKEGLKQSFPTSNGGSLEVRFEVDVKDRRD